MGFLDGRVRQMQAASAAKRERDAKVAVLAERDLALARRLADRLRDVERGREDARARRAEERASRPAPLAVAWGIGANLPPIPVPDRPFFRARQVSVVAVNGAPRNYVRFDATALEWLQATGAKRVTLYVVTEIGVPFHLTRSVDELPAVLAERKGE